VNAGSKQRKPECAIGVFLFNNTLFVNYKEETIQGESLTYKSVFLNGLMVMCPSLVMN
jgi:hypothetical protein